GDRGRRPAAHRRSAHPRDRRLRRAPRPHPGAHRARLGAGRRPRRAALRRRHPVPRGPGRHPAQGARHRTGVDRRTGRAGQRRRRGRHAVRPGAGPLREGRAAGRADHQRGAVRAPGSHRLGHPALRRRPAAARRPARAAAGHPGGRARGAGGAARGTGDDLPLQQRHEEVPAHRVGERCALGPRTGPGDGGDHRRRWLLRRRRPPLRGPGRANRTRGGGRGMTRTLIVIGHGMVGHRLVEVLRQRDTSDAWRIVVFGEEPRPAYDRVALSSYLDGKSAEDLSLTSQDLQDDPMVELRLGTAVTGIDRTNRIVSAADGTAVGYDALVLATGSRPFVPPVPGRDLDGCFVYRTIEDLDAIRAAATEGAPGVVIGGGLLGLEAAGALRRLGMRTHVVEMAPRLMPLQVDEGGGQVLNRLVTDLGLTVHCGAAIESIDGDDRVRSIALADGTVLDTELVVFSAGVRPRDELAEIAGLERGERGGFLGDECCRTSDERIWAVGECGAVNGRCYGLVAPGYSMAEGVADQLLELGDGAFPGADLSTKLKLIGVDVASFGDA